VLAAGVAPGQVLEGTLNLHPYLPISLLHVPDGNKLYVAVQDSGYAACRSYHIFVVDCAAVQVIRTIRDVVFSYSSPAFGVHVPRHERVYFAGSSKAADAAFLVIDSRGDSVLARLPVGVCELSQPGSKAMAYNSTRDKLYAVTPWGVPDGGEVVVLDCATDSVIKRIRTEHRAGLFAVWDSAGDKVYFGSNDLFGEGSDLVTVLDCATDSVIAIIRTGLVAPGNASLDPQHRKLYVAPTFGGYWTGAVIDTRADTVVSRQRWGERPMDGARLPIVHNPIEAKLYWPIKLPDTLLVVDCAVDSVIRSIVAPVYLGVRGSFHHSALTAWTNRLYALVGVAAHGNLLSVYDSHTDSIIGMTRLGDSYATTGEVLPNPVDRRIYVTLSTDSSLHAFRDELQAVSEEQPAATRPAAPLHIAPNPARDRVRLAGSETAELYAPDGRRVAALAPGENDIRQLARGVYFVRRQDTGESSRLVLVR
jgi:DNA-binding beta-propeller fold protein YncE